METFVSQFKEVSGIELVSISAGTFTMGRRADEQAGTSPFIDVPQTQVTLTQDFFLGATVVTRAQWMGVIDPNHSVSSGERGVSDEPAETSSWLINRHLSCRARGESHDIPEETTGLMGAPWRMENGWVNAMAFCQKLTEREQAAGRLPGGYAFTLPTEAQWE